MRLVAWMVLPCWVGLAVGCGPSQPTKVQPPGGLGGGLYTIEGQRPGGSALSKSGQVTGKDPIEVEWPVSKQQYDQLKEGMSPAEVKAVLGLSELKFDPSNHESEFHVVLNSGPGTTTLVFTKPPDLNLAKKSAEGLQ